MLTDFSTIDIIVLALAAFLVGMRRGGLQGTAVVAVTLVVSNFGGRFAVGICLVLFILADIQAIWIFIRDVNWSLLLRILLPTVVGIGAAALFGNDIPEKTYQWILFILVIIAYLGLFLNKRLQIDFNSPRKRLLITIIFGFLTGVTSMIGNIASVFLTIYFAAIGSSKKGYIATTVWFFFIINLIKLPIHLFSWETINLNTLLSAIIFLPLISLGIITGKVVTKRFSETTYWRFVLAIAAVGIIRLLLSIMGIQ